MNPRKWIDSLLDEILEEKVLKRPGRRNLRVKKGRRPKYPEKKKRPARLPNLIGLYVLK